MEQPIDYDSPWKEILDYYFAEFMDFFFPQAYNDIDWLIQLPEELENEFWYEIEQYEGGKYMPYVTSVERIGIKKGFEQGIKQGIELGLELKFGSEGLLIMPEIRCPESYSIWNQNSENFG
jgi:hypothetical protein